MGLRIISGELRGKRLRSVHGKAIRPTADRLRESIFNILSSGVLEAVVLDLFAGTGALGIEALSRGAESAVFIDSSSEAISTIASNVKLCAFDNRAIIIKWNIEYNLNCLKSIKPAFDLIFIDPPYNKNMIKPALIHLDRSGSLRKGACLVVEHSPFEPIPDDLFVFQITDQRRYGKTLVSFLNYVV